VAAVVAAAAYFLHLRAQLAAAPRDNGEFVAAALREKLAQQQALPAPVAQTLAHRRRRRADQIKNWYLAIPRSRMTSCAMPRHI